MANCSIPNSTRATGRISTPSSRRSRSSSKRASVSFASVGRWEAGCHVERSRDIANCLPISARDSSTSLGMTKTIGSTTQGAFNAPRSTLNAQRSVLTVGRWMLVAGRWTFSFSRRVKGAWWPSRSSKPSSPRKWRGRFDSYPLRHFKFEGRWLKFDFSLALGPFTSNLKDQTPNYVA
jgi:hypothetical protein